MNRPRTQKCRSYRAETGNAPPAALLLLIPAGVTGLTSRRKKPLVAPVTVTTATFCVPAYAPMV